MRNKRTNLSQYSFKYLIALDIYFSIFENNEEDTTYKISVTEH